MDLDGLARLSAGAHGEDRVEAVEGSQAWLQDFEHGAFPKDRARRRNRAHAPSHGSSGNDMQGPLEQEASSGS